MTDSVPQLEPTDAVKQAFNRIQDINGRSRRSEFWWAMLAFVLIYYFLDSFIKAIDVPVVLPFVTAFLKFWNVGACPWSACAG